MIWDSRNWSSRFQGHNIPIAPTSSCQFWPFKIQTPKSRGSSVLALASLGIYERGRRPQNRIPRMGRARIPITWIKSDAARQVTYTKRRKGLKKKIEELAILCGVEACMICYGPPQAGKPSVPFSWGLPDVSQVISKYQSLSKEEQDKKKLDNKSFLEQQIKKLKVELKLRIEQNQKLQRERAYPMWDERLNSYGVEDLTCLEEYLAEKVRQTHDRISQLTNEQHEVDGAQADKQFSSLNPKNIFLLEGQSSAGEYDFMQRPASAFPGENISRNIFRQAAAPTLPFPPLMNFPAALGLQAYPTTENNSPVHSSQELYADISMPDLSATFSDPGARSEGGLLADMHQMLTISGDDQMQQLPEHQSTLKLLQQLQDPQYGFAAGRLSSHALMPSISSPGISLPFTSRKKLQFNPTVMDYDNHWEAADPQMDSQTARVLEMEVGDGSEALHLQLQASLDGTRRCLDQQQSVHTWMEPEDASTSNNQYSAYRISKES